MWVDVSPFPHTPIPLQEKRSSYIIIIYNVFLLSTHIGNKA